VRLRVASYNIRKCVGLDWRRRPDRVLAVLAEIGADVVALQEADRRFGAKLSALPPEALAEAGWHAAPVAPHPGGLGWRGNAILLGPRAEAEATLALPLPALEPRGAAIAALRIDGRRLVVVGAHLGLTARRRALQAAAIAEALDAWGPGPSVLLGDMNEPRPAAGCHAIFAERWRMVAPRPTFHASAPVAALDRIGLGAGVALRAVEVHKSALARRASDHLPLWADLELTEAPA